MRKIFFSAVAFLIAATLFSQNNKNDPANFEKYAEANKTAPRNSVVFMGNSITEGWTKTHPDFFEKNNYVGRGIGGQTSSQMLVRFRADVVNLKPQVVVILAGTNDIARNAGYISLENILDNIISMYEIARANNIGVILCSVLPACEFGWRKELQPAQDIIVLNQMIKKYAQQNSIRYVDYHTVLKDERNGLPGKYASDGVHPNSDAYLIMEDLVKKAIDNFGIKVRKEKKERQYLFQRPEK